jgi:CubicO group peptidase (beta-lactamase class C family)
MAHQYWNSKNWDSYKHDISWDLYGGGGIASTTKDMATFTHALFNQQIITTDTIQNLLYTNFKIKETVTYPYYLGISQSNYKNYTSFGHGGFWGTTVRYFPAFNATIAISIQDKDFGSLRKNVLDGVVELLDKWKNQQAVNDSIKTYIASLKDFNGTILVAHNDSIISKKSNGYANLEFKIPNTTQTLFNIASITKLMTAIGILQLQDSGLIDINKPVGYYLDDYPNQHDRDSEAIHQLLSHTSGVPPIYSDKLLNSPKNTFKKIQDFLPLIVNDSLAFKPGTEYAYSGGGYLLLGLIIEKVTHKSYYDYMREDVFSTIEMNHTVEIDLENLNPTIASGYTSFLSDDGSIKKNEYYLTKTSPAGFYYSTIDDLFIFSKAMRNGTLIHTETWEQLITPQTWGYSTQLGLGIDIDHRYNQKIVGHSGGWYGVRAELLDFLGTNHTIIVLSNIDDNGDTGASKVIDDLKEIVAGRKR